MCTLISEQNGFFFINFYPFLFGPNSPSLFYDELLLSTGTPFLSKFQPPLSEQRWLSRLNGRLAMTIPLFRRQNSSPTKSPSLCMRILRIPIQSFFPLIAPQYNYL